MREPRHPFLRWIALSILGFSSLIPGHAAERPRIYALTNATIVVSPEKTMEGATLVLRDGLVEAVGVDIEAPDDAVEIDLEGSWIYPGFVDPLSRLGVKESESSRRGSEASAPESGAVHPIPKMRAEYRVRDRLLPFTDDRKGKAKRYRELGFTAVLATPDSGVLRGRSTAISLADDLPVSELILEDDVAQHAAFERGRFGQGYPTSLMGAVAALRQVFLDAGRYDLWSRRYSEHPRGMARPELHATHEALLPVIRREQPLFITVESPEDALLAHKLAAELEIDAVLVASGNEWEIARQVAATGRTLILPVAFPDKPKLDSDAEALETSRRTLRRYVEAPAGPGRLHEAGVRFALTTHGLKNTADFHKNLRRIVEHGLPQEIALAALTTIPAELLGIDSMLGTLDAGKIANLFVTSDSLFAEKSEVTRIFVDGVEYEVEKKERPQGDPDAVVDPRGEWSVVFEFGERTIQRAWTVSGERDAYTGTAETRGGIVTFDEILLEGNVMTVTFPARGGRGASEVTVVIEGDTFEGTAEMGPRSTKVSGSRTGGPEGGAR